MNLTFLRYAVEVEKTGSISLAARNLYLGQPNVSKAIKELEHTMGVTLFKRTPRGVVPTPKGEEFLYYAKNILAQIDGLENMFREEHADRVSFHVAVPRAAYITQAFADFTATLDPEKGMDMTYYEMDAMECIDRVAQQEYDMGIIRYDKAHESQFLSMLSGRNLVSKPIWEMSSRLLISREHPLTQQSAIDMAHLADAVELCFGDNASPFMSAAEARNSAALLAQKKHISINSMTSLWELLHSVRGAYMWTSPIPADILDNHNCVQCTVAGAPLFKDVLIYHKDYRLRDLDKQFIAHLNRTKDIGGWAAGHCASRSDHTVN